MIKEKLAEGYTPEQIIDYGLRLMREGPYEGLTTVHPKWIRKNPYPPHIDFPEMRG